MRRLGMSVLVAFAGATVIVAGTVPVFAVATVPDGPTGVTARMGSDGEWTDVAWVTPADDGGSAIDAYSIRASQDAGAHWNTVGGTDCYTDTCPPATSKRVWYEFTAYHRYLVQVRAHNAQGWGAWSASLSFYALPGGRPAPLPPRDVSTIADDHSILVRWTPAPDAPYDAWRHWFVIEWVPVGSSWSLARSASTVAKSYLITGLDESKSWQIRLRTYREETDVSPWKVISGIRMADNPQRIVDFDGLPRVIARDGRTAILPCGVHTNAGHQVRAYLTWTGPRWRSVDDDAVVVKRSECGGVAVITKGQPVRITVGLWATPAPPKDGLLTVRIYRTWDSAK